jgi:hypothetical protein
VIAEGRDTKKSLRVCPQPLLVAEVRLKECLDLERGTTGSSQPLRCPATSGAMRLIV